MSHTKVAKLGSLAANDAGGFKIGPFGSSLKKSELVERGIPVAGIENVLPNEFVAGFRRFVTERKFRELAEYEILPSDVLVTTMGTIGRAAVAPPSITRTIIDSHLLRIRPDLNRVNPLYLCYAINSDEVARQLERAAHGAIMEGLNTSMLKECLLSIPGLAEQHRITTLLQKADRFRRLRRYAIELTDSFLQTAFLDLFGDPATNPKNWDMATIDDAVASSQYGTSRKSNLESRGWPVLGMGNITYSGYVDLGQLSFVELSRLEYEELRLESGDIIFNRTNSTELVGKTACWRLEANAVLASYLVKLRLTRDFQAEFFVALLNTPYFKRLFRERCKEAVGQSNISPTLLKEFPVYVPPTELQVRFRRLVERHNRLRFIQRESLRQVDHCFQTLLRRAFTGEANAAATEELEPAPAR